jgi:hypothetical protein
MRQLRFCAYQYQNLPPGSCGDLLLRQQLTDDHGRRPTPCIGETEQNHLAGVEYGTSTGWSAERCQSMGCDGSMIASRLPSVSLNHAAFSALVGHAIDGLEAQKFVFLKETPRGTGAPEPR